jgi:hypothetical protein
MMIYYSAVYYGMTYYNWENLMKNNCETYQSR